MTLFLPKEKKDLPSQASLLSWHTIIDLIINKDFK